MDNLLGYKNINKILSIVQELAGPTSIFTYCDIKPESPNNGARGDSTVRELFGKHVFAKTPNNNVILLHLVALFILL
jgi:hypothetical protein